MLSKNSYFWTRNPKLMKNETGQKIRTFEQKKSIMQFDTLYVIIISV